jgi:saccharopine dehydrogenase-like NADP-dependent oxidoreductase
VGGSGRVGASTVRWINKLGKAEQLPVELAIGGRRRASFDAAAKRLGAKGVDDIKFVQLDLDDAASLERAVAGRSLVVHTAGPFQQRTDPTLLKACIDAGVPYCDVCDELELSRAAKKLTSDVPAVISCGIWPGASALLAARAAERLGKPLDDLEFSFFTSGTGGAGPTIVSATFLLLCTPAAVYADGELVMKEPWTEKRTAAFGPGIGERDVYLLDNPDVPTCAEALGARSASSSFGTAPAFWNDLFGAMKLLPRSLLADRGAMQNLAEFSMPIIRTVDALVGGVNAMRVDARAADGDAVTLRVAHGDLEDCVGQATAAFCMELLRGGVAPGCWYPAELPVAARDRILAVVEEGAVVWEV